MVKWIAGFLICCLAGFPSQDTYQSQRETMVKTQIERRGVKDPATLTAMRKTPRHEFVPKEALPLAYDDSPLGIGYGQTISQPYIVAFMTEQLQLGPGKKVLEVGTGSAYQAAVLAEIADQVYTIEIVNALGEAARERLSRLEYKNVEVKLADGYYGWPEKGPFDAIMVTAAAEFIPPPLIDQLKEGGKMIIPVGSPFQVQYLMLVEKLSGGKTKTSRLMPVRFVPFTRKK